MKIVSGMRVVIVNCVISSKIKINKTIQTLKDCCTTMEMSPEMQWLPTKRIKRFRRRGVRMAIKNYLGSFVLKNLKIFHESEVVFIAPYNVTIIKQGKDETIVKS